MATHSNISHHIFIIDAQNIPEIAGVCVCVCVALVLPWNTGAPFCPSWDAPAVLARVSTANCELKLLPLPGWK